MVKQQKNAENSAVKKKKKLKKEQTPPLEELEEDEQTPVRKKKLKKHPESFSEEEEEISTRKKRRIVRSVDDGSSSMKKAKRPKENIIAGKLAEEEEEGKHESAEKKKKKKKKRIEKGAIDGQGMRAEEDPHAKNGVHCKLHAKTKSSEEDPQSENGLHEKGGAKTANVSFRLLVPSRDIGKVIGTQGSRIQQLREETSAHIKIGNAIMNLNERVISITSKEETLASQSAAERALLAVATYLLKPELEDEESAKIQLLISESQAKIVVGKEGVILNKIRKDTGADVNVYSKDKFALLAVASDTDRLLQLVGRTSQVQQALELVTAILRKSPQHSQDAKMWKAATKGGGFETTTQIKIPADIIGKLIGKEGSTIRPIRQQSGASIQVDKDTADAAQEIIVHVKGMLSQVTMAQTLLQVALATKKGTR